MLPQVMIRLYSLACRYREPHQIYLINYPGELFGGNLHTTYNDSDGIFYNSISVVDV